VLDLFPETAGGGASTAPKDCTFFAGKKGHDKVGRKTSKGSAARFFYCPKASKKDRNEGCEDFEDKTSRNYRTGNTHNGHGGRVPDKVSKNNHPTVKPTALMAYLCRLITPTGGVVLDPYMGSGSTGKAAVREGFSFTGIELDPDYYEICKARIPTT
jgi:site-specific DNA-methyltransferase (adenine-specific)